MSTNYDDIIAAATGDEQPRRTRKGALKYQPADTDWSLDRLTELQDFYQSTYKKPLPLTVKGQGSIHNKWGLDHRSSADISLNPASAEGKALVSELQRRRIPFLAFESAIPGASTGPHIHVGRPSSRSGAKFGVGSQVKKTAQQKPAQPADYSDIISAATGDTPSQPTTSDYDDVINAAIGKDQPARKSTGLPNYRVPFGSNLPAEAVRAGIADFERKQPTRDQAAITAGVAEFERRQSARQAIEAGVADFEAGPPTIDAGNALPVDTLEREKAAVRQQRQPRLGYLGDLLIGGPAPGRDPLTLAYNAITGTSEEEAVDQLARERIDTRYKESERLKEIVSQFTDEDRRQLAMAVERMRSQGSISRGIETGTQRMGSGLLYKLAAITDLAGPPPGQGSTPNNVLGDYLRRQAARGEVAVSEIEADLPPDTRQQLADFAAHAISALPEIVGATAVAGPVGGFAALGGLEATGRKQTFAEIAKETAKGAVIGAVFKAAPLAETGGVGRTFAQRTVDTARSGAAIGLGTYGVEKAFGAEDSEALRAAASNVVFHLGMRVPGEVGRLAQAAERALKTPEPEGGRPTVGPELQEQLSRAETPPPPPTPLAEVRPTVPPAEITTAQPAPARPAAEQPVAAEPAAPSRLAERRGPSRVKDADWLELTPEEQARVRQQVDLEQRFPTEPGPAQTPILDEPVARRPLAELMRERAETGPTEAPTIVYPVQKGQTVRNPETGEVGKVVGEKLDGTAIVRVKGKESSEVWNVDNRHVVEPEAINLLTGKPVKGEPAKESGFIRLDLGKPKSDLEDLYHERGKGSFGGLLVKPKPGKTLEPELLTPEGVHSLMRLPANAKVEVDASGGYSIIRIFDRAGARDFDAELALARRLQHRFVEQPQELSGVDRPEAPAQPKEVLPNFRAGKTALDQFLEEVGPGVKERLKRERETKNELDDVIDLGDIDAPKKPPRGEGGFVDLNEIREGLRAGKVRIEEAIEQARKRFPNSPEEKVRAILARDKDPLIGIADQTGVSALDNPYRAMTHSIVFRESLRQSPGTDRWRYEPRTQKVYWDEWNASKMPSLNHPTVETRTAVESYLAQKGLKVESHGPLSDLNHKQLWDADIEAAAKPPVHHAAQQPRSPTGQFEPGAPGGPEAARSQLRDEARKYQEQFRALDSHKARRDGLDIVNDEVAGNYFAQLRRITAEHLPNRVEAVDRAESLYNQGKYGQATMLAEGVFRSLPDKVNEYVSASAAIQLTERGLEAKTNWTKVLQEVRERIKRTGPLSGGGSTFYDVNKYPEGGRPDHAKIAYILEPVVAALRADAARLVAEGKLKATDYVAHIRTQANKMLAGEEFTDWHPLNKSAAMGVLVDQLRKDGPPPAAPTTEAPPPQRKRSLPPTLERSGRDPGTNLTYDRLPNETVNARVEQRLASEGAEALESWYRSAPESADRTAAHRVLVDHYTAESVRLADTAPQRAQELWQQARDLSNLEAERATTIGQTMQMYSNLLRYTPAGVLREISRMERAGIRVPAEHGRRLTEAAHEHQRLDREVQRLEREVAQREVEAGEAPPPAEGAEAPTRPRRYRPRTTAGEAAETATTRRRARRAGATGGGGGRGGRTPADRAETARRQLDEAARRRRAQRQAIANQLRAIEQQRTATGYWKRAMNITRGLMVSQLQTAMRNLQSQVVRFDVERLVDAVEHTMRRSVGLDSDFTYRNIWRNTARQFRPGQTAEAREILTGHDLEYTRMFNNYAGGVDVPIPGGVRGRVERVFQTVERGVEMANYVNRLQEFHVRSAEFLAELDLHLRREHNQTLEQYVRRNGIDAIPQELIQRSVTKALEVTFADMPLRDGAGGRLLTSMIEMGNYIPPTVSPVAFPRFMFNNLKFLYQHSPAGMLDLARRNQNRPRVIARSLVGTSMLLLAYQFRKSDHAGEKWYELKFGDTTLDARPFGPFSTYLFMAEAIRRQLNGEKAFTVQEIAGAIGASSGPGGTAIAVAEKLYEYAANGKWDKWQRILKTEAGEWGRALLTPVRQVKDLIAAFDESQAVMRDTSEAPFTGPMRESIPFASTDLPPAQRATTATPIKQERPAVKALTGWRVITPKTFLERELDSMNFAGSEVRGNTGIPAIDALEKRLMGPLMDELSRELEADGEYRRLSKKARANYLREILTEIREEVREMGQDEQPELYEQLREERKPRRQREFEQELDSPGLSSALRLGVPMAVPPRRPGEDDLSYRARLLQTARQRRGRLDNAVDFNLPPAEQRTRLHQALYSG